MSKYLTILIFTVSAACSNHGIDAHSNIPKADSALITRHLARITKTNGYRNYRNTAVLNQTADYILSIFQQYADTAWFQPYTADGRTYKNVVCRFGKSNKPLIVAGAHYDVCGDQEGADDNASGVTALLELARLLKDKPLEHPVELVAYSLEEPPFFRTPYMGSYIHAKSLSDQNIPVYGMIAVEMIGFYSTGKGSQNYPLKPMKVVYGTAGDFILLAKRTGSGQFVRRFSSAFNQVCELSSNQIKAPARTAGIDFSDHLNYWSFDYDALMVTNTAFYRNENYHRSTDTMETLDIAKMALVIDAIFNSLLTVTKEEQAVAKKFQKKASVKK
jgi:hypothetical protein